MKKMMLFFALLVTLVSCKTKQAAATSTTVDRKSQTAIKGNWTLTSVNYTGENLFKVNSFQIADSNCFEGSNWTFVSNNDSGNVALTKGGCPSFSSAIKWYVTKEQQFVLKFLNPDDKARKVTQGYVLALRNQTEDSFQLVDRVDIGGKLTDIVYQFQKNK